MLTQDERNRIIDIVGPAWVNTDPCMLDTYAFYMNPEVMNRDGGRWLPRPGAVVMPANTAEVSRLVKLCNELDLMVKPISTGWGTWAAASSDRVVVLDLKRMDRILDIDVKNQIAVVEPYVKAILLQTELFKVGLNVHVVSCGGNHSLLAASTAAWGYGLTGSSMSYSGRNLLGVEWVLPSGEVVTLGSAGSGAGWFSADGPGPSLRGVMRGFSGSFGGLGVFTKAAIKLYRWDGPKELEVAGASPHYRLTEIPKNLGLFALAFPSAKALADAGYKLGEAELSYAEFRLPAFMQALGTTANNLELKKLWETGTFQKIAPWSLILAVSGQSDREYAWKMRALKEVLAETGGVNLPLQIQPPEPLFPAMKQVFKFIDDPLKLLRAVPPLAEAARNLPVNPEVRLQRLSDLFWVLVRHATNTQGNFRPSQSMFTSLGSFDTWDLGLKQSAWIAERKQEYIRKGLILDDGGDAGCGGTFENGHLGYLEGIGMYAAKNPESVKAVAQLIDEGTQACITESLGIPIAGFGSVMNERFGPHCGNYHEWMKKIKAALDPNTACDPFFYVKSNNPESLIPKP